ncbi:sporulation membrane protein YtaF [Bacillus aquiflavi]|uniref:Sporulation membrane protein YtaF n=1 Tax=Bacillus aquiflavi TaxID=2672567 RepID=A0A6B3VTS6_9BACI|nr:sporulation membrane protein YtaF [Bacillus aquiflavi]MBA4537092.1 sporulation membrane protein YtaF [Bacillus aquiflavi]NEY81389.1 sporulation membrane protein YtaF [Bacillus aquiflavi]UAC47525.1 sporulation membrane protein YtaF [Bacillus aquiflavi]
MLVTLSILLLAFAVSLDSFTVGFTYGLRNMRIPLKSLVIIATCSAISMTVAMTIGHVIATIFSPVLGERVGGFILILIGTWVIYQFFQPEKTKDQAPLAHEKMIVKFEIKSIGLAIHILRKPMSADFDRSGTITGMEAFLLGIALSLDAFGAGIGAAMLGFSPIFLAASVAIMSPFFVFLGIKSGSAFSKYKWVQKLTFIPGVLLILIGAWKI